MTISRSSAARRPAEALPAPPSPADLAECARRGITYPRLLAERAGAPRGKTSNSVHTAVNRVATGEQKTRTLSAPPSDAVSIDVVRLTLPWSALLPDNRRTGVGVNRNGDEPRPFVGTTKAYRLAKAKAIDAIETQIGDLLPGSLLATGWQPLYRDPVAIMVTLIEPNRSAKRDLLNYQKLICDAMSGVVYADDSLIDDAHFTRGTPDIDRPRAEITVTPIGAKP